MPTPLETVLLRDNKKLSELLERAFKAGFESGWQYLNYGESDADTSYQDWLIEIEDEL